MKLMTKLVSVLLAALLAFSGAVTVCASDGEAPVLPTPADNQIDTSVFVKTVLENPKVKQKNADKLIRAAFSLADADAKISDMLSQKALTGQNVIVVLAGMISAIDNALASDPQSASMAGFIGLLFNNTLVVNGLQADEKFSGAATKIQNAIDGGCNTVSDLLTNGIEFTSADFGFADGDAYGFVDALVCTLLNICAQLNVRSILGDFTDSTQDGAYVIGNYNLFIPLYELLELEPISSAEFTRRVTESENATDTLGLARLRTAANLTLKPVADLLTRLENEGASAAIDLLPKLLYALDSGMVNDLVCDLLRDKNLYGFVQFNDMLEKINLNTDLLWKTVDERFVTGTQDEDAGFDFDKDGKKETPLPLTKEQFDALAKQLTYAADPLVKPSVSAAQKNRLALQTDASLVSAILCAFIVDLLESDAGAAFAEKAVGSLDRKLVRLAAGSFVSLFRSDFGRFLLRNSQSLLASAATLAAFIHTRVRKAAV